MYSDLDVYYTELMDSIFEWCEMRDGGIAPAPRVTHHPGKGPPSGEILAMNHDSRWFLITVVVEEVDDPNE